MKQRCIRLYKAAHKKCCERYDELIAQLETKANEAGTERNPNQDIVSKYKARADAVRQMKEASEDEFLNWYEQDKKEFDKVDENNNGVLEADEFSKFLKETYKMNDSECQEAMQKWDVDANQSIGIYEWCTFKSVHRAEFNLMLEKLVTNIMIEMMDKLFPCGMACYMGCGVCALYCCCPTCGLACIPFCCMSKMMLERMESPEFQKKMEEEMEKATEEARAKSIQAAKKTLLLGPNDTLRSSVQAAQKSTEGTPLLAVNED